MALWQAGIGGGRAAPLVVRREDARWVEGGLTAAGMSVLSLELLAKTAYQMGGVTGAAVHVFNRWQWAEADFTLNGKSERLPIDGMSLRNAGGEFKPLARGQVYYPPTQRNNAAVTYYSAVGTLAEVAVDIATGRGIVESPLIMECGNLIVPELVSGQLQGGLAMGIGHALHEYLPLYEDGPGNGTELQPLPSAARQRRGGVETERRHPAGVVGNRSAERHGGGGDDPDRGRHG